MDLPIDHFRLLGVSPASDAQTVLRTLAQRLDRVPDQGFTTETLQARAKLLHDSADLLSDRERRIAYECELTAVAEGPAGVPALDIPSHLEVAGLLLLLEAGQASEAFEMACRALQPPQAPALGSSREADLSLLAALACLATARESRGLRHFEAAARQLRQGLQLLQRMGQLPEMRQQLAQDLDALSPYLVLDLLSRELTAEEKRAEGLQLLEQLVSRRGGLEGEQDPSFSGDEFQAFFKQIRDFLTVQEQVDLFSRWADAGSEAADFLAT
ncbi:MAG: molecular chaperone DnaJ, partial [Cyanobium sp.]